MAFSSASTLQQTDEVAAVASGSLGGGGGGSASTWDALTGELSGPVPFDATDDDGNPVPRGADFLNTSVEVRWERDPANGVALRVRDVTSGNDLLETNEGGLTDVPALNVQDTLTIPEKGDGAGQYIGDADFQLGTLLARDTATDPDTLDVTLKAGTNITIESDGTINATGGTGSATDILEGGTEVVADATDVDFESGDFDVTKPSGSKAAVALANDTVTVAGNSVALGESTSVDHGDLSSIGSNDHHTRYSDEEAQDAVGTILTDSGAASVTYDDAGNTITISATDTNTQLSDSEVQTAINNDSDHGSTASHNYTTSASRLSDVSPDSDPNAHHAVFEPADYNPVSDVEAHGNALAIDITGDADTLDGVEGGNYARTDVNETFSEEVVIEGETVVNSVSGLTASGNNKNTDWNLDYQHKIIGLNNALTFTVPSDTNNREAAIQAGHSSGGFSNFPGDLYLNPVGGDVVVGGDAGFGGETAPSYAVDVDGRAQATTVEATDTLLIPEK